jgi:hypothetical protein
MSVVALIVGSPSASIARAKDGGSDVALGTERHNECEIDPHLAKFGHGARRGDARQSVVVTDRPHDRHRIAGIAADHTG